jgi:hypothetical protein
MKGTVSMLKLLPALLATALLMSIGPAAKAETITFDCAISNGVITADSGNGCEFTDDSVSFSFGR